MYKLSAVVSVHDSLTYMVPLASLYSAAYLFEQGATISMPSPYSYNYEMLFFAVRNETMLPLLRYLTRTPAISSFDSLKSSKPAIYKSIIAAPLERRDNKGWFPIHEACLHGHLVNLCHWQSTHDMLLLHLHV
jgi:ankyrin repeat protein